MCGLTVRCSEWGIASLLQSLRLVGAVAELGSLGRLGHYERVAECNSVLEAGAGL
jgi:hypothetical protein